MSMEKVMRVAVGHIGYTESPPDSNRTKFGEAYGLNGYPWCVMFLWWCFREAGESSAFFGGAKTASCGILLRWYAEQGQTVSKSDILPGDIVIMNFDGSGDTSHCGLVTAVNGGSVETIEGNTSGGTSQDNGGRVMRKTRYPSQIVGVCRPQYKTAPVTDYAGHWAEEAIDKAITGGLMVGDGNGKFRPDDKVTRAELATVLVRLEERWGQDG